MSAATPWHKLFRLTLVDFFRGMPVNVEPESDLSLRQQLLDVILLRKEATPLLRRLPDGFEDLAAHNLVTFNSYEEAFDCWALNELVCQYVNYRKQISASRQELLPETDFRLFAVSVQFPQSLWRQTTLTRVQPGVYDVKHFTGLIRVVVVLELPQEEHNALLHLFSARPDLLQFAMTHYHRHSTETNLLLLQLFERYYLEARLEREGLEQFAEEMTERLLKKEPDEWTVKELSAESRVKGLSAETLVKGLSADEIYAALSPEKRALVAERLKAYGSLPDPNVIVPEHDGNEP